MKKITVKFPKDDRFGTVERHFNNNGEKIVMPTDQKSLVIDAEVGAVITLTLCSIDKNQWAAGHRTLEWLVSEDTVEIDMSLNVQPEPVEVPDSVEDSDETEDFENEDSDEDSVESDDNHLTGFVNPFSDIIE
jgi:hypothetical protein